MIRIGTSGFSYPDWRGVFFPVGLRHAGELAYYAARFGSVEINRSFYALLSPKTCLGWYDATPAGFLFPLKGSRYLTHLKRLREPTQALANFFAAGPLALGDKLGPIVWQLPERLAFDEHVVDAFFAALPRSMAEAALLAQRHEPRPRHPAFVEARVEAALRHVIEPRHPSFRCPAFAKLARQHGIAVAVADAGSWQTIEEPTTDFMYVRLHGSPKTYFSDYGEAELSDWAARIRGWQRGTCAPDAPRASRLRTRKAKDVYVYFDNTALGHALPNAQRLISMLEG